jgi:hypothetical protein
VGVESTRPFDEVVLEFTNPSTGSLSLDNLRFELDLADGRRRRSAGLRRPLPRVRGHGPGRRDGDGLGDACDAFPRDAADDADGDGIGADVDNCPRCSTRSRSTRTTTASATRATRSSAPTRTATESRTPRTTAPIPPTPDQFDCDDDGIGDVCDPTLISPAGIRVHLSRGQSDELPRARVLAARAAEADIVIASTRRAAWAARSGR